MIESSRGPIWGTSLAISIPQNLGGGDPTLPGPNARMDWSCPTAKASPAVRRALRGARNHPRFEVSSAWIFRPSYHRQDCALVGAFAPVLGVVNKAGRHKVPLTRPPQVARTSPPRFHPINQTDHYPT